MFSDLVRRLVQAVFVLLLLFLSSLLVPSALFSPSFSVLLTFSFQSPTCPRYTETLWNAAAVDKFLLLVLCLLCLFFSFSLSSYPSRVPLLRVRSPARQRLQSDLVECCGKGDVLATASVSCFLVLLVFIFSRLLVDDVLLITVTSIAL